MSANSTLGGSYDDSTWIDPYRAVPSKVTQDFLQAMQVMEPPAAPEVEQIAEPEPLESEEPLEHHEVLLELSRLADPESEPGDDPEAWHLPPPGIHTTGTQLRRRLVTPESIAKLSEARRPSLLGRLLRRG